MSTITRERLEWLSKISSRDEIDDIGGDEIRELARIALASLEAEPVVINDDMAVAFHCAITDSSLGSDEVEEIKTGLRAAFANAAPPAPVVPDEWPKKLTWSHHDDISQAEVMAWNNAIDACRAAMLQGNQPVSNRDELPLDYLQGHKDGLEWAAQLAEANHPQTGDWLYYDPLELAKAIRKGPDMPAEPVQGWIPCSERMPEIDGNYWGWWSECKQQGPVWFTKTDSYSYSQSSEITHWMPLPAAPKQGVK